MQAVSTSPFNLSMLRKHNVWYTIKDGNWSDPDTWISNSLDRKSILIPQPGDTIYINHSVMIDRQPNAVNNLYVSGKLSGGNALTLTIDGDLQVTGTLDFTSSSIQIFLNGYNNSVVNLTEGSSTFIYNSSFTQPIMPLTYNNLTAQNSQKYQSGNVTVGGTLLVYMGYECGNYNLTVNGITGIGNANTGVFSKSGSGNLLFVGKFTADNTYGYSSIDFSGGNPNVEFRGGITKQCYLWKTGTGTFTFTTNNQTITCAGNFDAWDCNITVSGPITVTNAATASGIQANGVINGDNASSTLTNNGNLYLASTTNAMATGVFNYQNTTSAVIGYVMNSTYTLPYTNYNGGVLYIGGNAGIKSLGGNTTVLTLNVANNFDTGTHGLTVNGLTNLSNANTGTFYNTGGGAMLFVGKVTGDSSTNYSSLDWSAGSPNAEFRGGLSLQTYALNFGTGTLKFSTNNQSFFCFGNAGGITNSANILVSGAITVTFTTGSVTGFVTSGLLNGDNALSIFDCRGIVNYQKATAPMATGKLFGNQAANTFIYGLTGNQDITTPSDAIPGYQNLTLNGSGAKRLLSNVSVKGVYTLTSPATLNSNGFALTNP